MKLSLIDLIYKIRGWDTCPPFELVSADALENGDYKVIVRPTDFMPDNPTAEETK